MLFINWQKTMDNLASALAFNQVKKVDFAHAIGVSPQSLSRYLKCQDTPSAQTFARMQKEISFQVVWIHTNTRG